MEEKVLIEAKNLKKYFKVGANSQLHAVDGVNFKIKRGTTLGVVGESGCGKSTLGRLLLRLYDVTDGQIIYDGTDITKLNAKELKPIRARMQMIFQDPSGSLDPRKSVKELIGEPLKIYKACKNRDEYDARIAEIMETVGLDERYAESFSHELDGGRRQRIGIGRALAMDPEFIICDEPVSALDVSIQAQILNLLMDLQDEKKLTYVFITHDLSVVKHISHEIMVMYLGQCVEYAKTEDLFKNPLHPYTKGLLDAVPIPSLKAKKLSTEVMRGELTSPVDPAPGCRFAARCPYATDACRGAFCFALIFGGDLKAGFAAAAAGVAANAYLLFCGRRGVGGGFRTISTAALITLCCILGCGLLGTEPSHAIIGTLMILTPGIAFTMGIRDFVQGDYLSGTIRMIDALLIAASIAIGTGLVLSLYAFLKGVAVV